MNFLETTKDDIGNAIRLGSPAVASHPISLLSQDFCLVVFVSEERDNAVNDFPGAGPGQLMNDL